MLDENGISSGCFSVVVRLLLSSPTQRDSILHAQVLDLHLFCLRNDLCS